MTGVLPFARYPGGGAMQYRRPKGDSTIARRGYACEVLPYCQYRCVYCGLSFTTFEAWLLLSADHVVPRSAIKRGILSNWIEDIANVVACCRTCNDFLNHYKVDRGASTEQEFLALRNHVFRDRHDKIGARREQERAWYDSNIAGA